MAGGVEVVSVFGMGVPLGRVIRCELDKAIKRRTSGDFAFPLGVYPVEAMTPIQGYSVEFEPADAGTGDEWEEWPDRYVFEAVISAERLRPLCRALYTMLPLRVYPILDVMGHDAYREIDPYIAYDPIGLDRFVEGVRRYGDFLYEDGLVGFGAMSDDPFLYFFLDEHKVVTVRCTPSHREQVEGVFRAFDLPCVPGPAGADAVAHEHRGVLYAPEEEPELLIAEEIVERLVEDWELTLNIDREANLDDEGRELGVTRWRCIVRAISQESQALYVEVLLHAESHRAAEDIALSQAGEALAARSSAFQDLVCVSADRMTQAQEEELLGRIRSQSGIEGNPLEPPQRGHVVVTRVLGGS